MNHSLRTGPWLLLVATLPPAPAAAQPDRAPPVPVTRAELKKVLEDSKKARPRLPLPPPTAEERQGAGGRSVVNNARMRQLYLPEELRGADFFRGPDPVQSLDGTFKTELFWIVSRANNTTYCLGHQEIKLSASGLTDDRIGALDLDWSEFSPAERAAFAFTRRLTSEPHTLTDQSIAELRKHYTDLQVLELIFTVANNNATNRWTGGLAIPQEEDGSALLRAVGKEAGGYRTFLTPTSAGSRDRPSRVAPVRTAERPAPESRTQVEAALAACRERAARLPLVAEAQARALLPDWPEGPLPGYVRLLAHFPKAGPARVLSLQAAEGKGTLSPKLKAQVAWLAAREDRAWYALGRAKRRLLAQGLSEDQVYALDAEGGGQTAGEKAALAFVRKLTAAPALVTDEDVAGLRKHFQDNEVAELVYHVCNAAFFNRLTEAAGLRLEE